MRRHAQIPALRSWKPHSGETVHQSSLCRHEVIIHTVAQSRLPTLSLMSAGSYRTKNSNLAIMNRLHSVQSHPLRPPCWWKRWRATFSSSVCPLFPRASPVSGEKRLSSSVFGARSSSGYLIIILSAARASLIDVPFSCLLQAHDLTKALHSTWPLLFSSPKTRWLHLLFETAPFYGSRPRDTPAGCF